MANNALGKHERQSISIMDLFKMFPDNDTAEKWFIINHRISKPSQKKKTNQQLIDVVLAEKNFRSRQIP